jgi:hypothetical protein
MRRLLSSLLLAGLVGLSGLAPSTASAAPYQVSYIPYSYIPYSYIPYSRYSVTYPMFPTYPTYSAYSGPYAYPSVNYPPVNYPPVYYPGVYNYSGAFAPSTNPITIEAYVSP